MKDTKALNLAACILREHADSLRSSHTVNGEWTTDEREVKREHDLMRRLAKQLEAIAAENESLHRAVGLSGKVSRKAIEALLRVMRERHPKNCSHEKE